MGAIAQRLPECFKDKIPFHLFHFSSDERGNADGWDIPDGIERAGSNRSDLDHLRADVRAVCKQDRAMNDVLQLAHIAPPVVRGQAREGQGGKWAERKPVYVSVSARKMFSQGDDIARPFP